MTNGAGAVGHTHRHVGPTVGVGMASFMTKKKKYKFHVDVCLEELVEVPFVSAVLFAKLRLLDGGSFQDTSSRQEVLDHRVQWNASFTFPCKMMANASTGVMERCVLRVSVRKESKGGRSFTKLGFVDLNLAEYAGAGVVRKKALLEGYDARRRQDNSMLKFRIELSMVSGDILFKAPSPSLKHKQINVDEGGNEQRSDEFSSGSLAGSIASGSSGFGSLPKKRPALLSSDLVIGQTLQETNAATPPIVGDYASDLPTQPDPQEPPIVPTSTTCSSEPGHSRNSSNTSQLSKASGYSSGAHSHSRQSSSGDSGHVRNQQHSHSVRARNHSTPTGTFFRTNTYPKKINIPNTIPSNQEVFLTPECLFTSTPTKKPLIEDEVSFYSTPKGFFSQNSTGNSSGTEEYKTPETSGIISAKTDVFSQNFNELQKSSSTSVMERIKTDMMNADLMANQRKSDTVSQNNNKPIMHNGVSMENLEKEKNLKNNAHKAVLRSKSEFQIPKIPPLPAEKSLTTRLFNSNSLISFLTPRLKRKSLKGGRHSPPSLTLCPPPTSQALKSLPESRATSLSSLRSGCSAGDVQRNPSAGSLVISETGSLDRAKAAYERRKKNKEDSELGSSSTAPGRVEITRVNPDDLIEELLKNTNLETADDSAETSGLQLFIAKDGTAAVGNHEVKSQMQTGGVQIFKQVVMDDR
ncbi:unnamed protein product [Acanthoscelides obtectus]|uniref:C2 NT-type domain-containing protein n=1 Tax=Acanthoscelides obtectus TaxID=200917 RepID=A0A9P0JK01_ACAOB|nr:unnamed protein product [Acanthoscelides obtectus]CAK1665665.1 Protein FAM102A [Acanthoscelides obtectus]